MNPQKNNSATPLRCAALLCAALACHAAACHAERADRDKPMHLEANRVSIDDANQISTFEGNVQITQGTMTIRGDKIVVTQDKDGFTHSTATGQPANFRQKREGMDEYAEGFGETIKYDARSETVDLFGRARVKREQDEVSGEHITYNSRTEVFQVHGAQADASGSPAGTQGKGRVRAIIQPKSKSAGTAPAEPVTITPADTLARPENRQ
ncbi:MAG: lipopolysaccharide transport periplasmic protein LptA [Nitrosomonadales bacterium]|nr:lipopolysaccharide transport periplasmic protein LptA [Nitrosomonadales bacterium]